MPLNISAIMTLLGCALAGVIVCALCCWKSQLGMVLAPKLRKRKDQEVLAEFVSSDMTPMEEQDPELVLNPIFVHKMNREKDRQRKKKLAKMSSGTGKSGGLARLGINIGAQAEKMDPKKMNILAVDTFLEREKGVVDESKNLTPYEREMKAKELRKGAKKAATNSKLTEEMRRKEELNKARSGARIACKAAGEVQLQNLGAEEPGSSEPGSSSAQRLLRGNGSSNGKGYSAAL